MSLDKRYDFKKVEKDKYERRKNAGYFRAGDKSKQKFCVVIPPPNITGKLHIGHSIDTTIQDITCRYKKAKGFDVLYLPGCDHAGIATQAKIDAKLKEEGLSRFEIGREAFLKKAFEWKDEYSNIIHQQWATMGLMLDYSRERFTLDDGFQDAVYYVFKTMYDEGLIYRGERIVNYDPVMKTALSNIEVIYKEDKGKFYYFKYPFTDDNSKYLEIATTRPETMFGDTCIVVNPKDKRYKDLIGKYVINPANHESIPVIADEYVDIKFGTGAMKCTPAHDPNDFIIGKKYGFKHPVVINIDGTMNDLCGIYSGLDRYECRKRLVCNIEKEGNLIKIEEITHQVGHSERSDAVVEPILSKQWFIKMKPLCEAVLKNQTSDKKINFFPKRFEKVLNQWMSNCDDWCISRQLWWGHRIPVYYSKSTNNILISNHKPENPDDWVQDEDVLDTWFSSALWPFATLGWPNKTEDFERYFPTDVLVTGYDIIFFWVARMYFQSLKFTKQIPFKNVVIHGLVRDSYGRKMSKSLGNGIDPINVANKYGIDSLRYFLATTASPGLDMRYDEVKIESANNYLNKIWNSARFILNNIEEYKDFKLINIDIKKLNKIDKFILNEFEKAVKKINLNMDKYEYGIASSTLYNFVYDEFCSFYLEMCKVTLNDESYKNTCLNILLFILIGIIKMIYPFSPFFAEEIYLNLPLHNDSIMLESYPEYEKIYISKTNFKDIKNMKSIIETVRSYKSKNKLPPNEKLTLYLDGNFDDNLLPYLKKFTFAENIYKGKKDNSTNFIFDNLTLYIIDNIDKNKLKESLIKQLEKINFELQRSESLLNNEKFLSKAPKDKISVEKEKYKTYLSQKEEIEKNLKIINK